MVKTNKKDFLRKGKGKGARKGVERKREEEEAKGIFLGKLIFKSNGDE